MQTIGYFTDKRNGEIILVLIRIGKRIDDCCNIIDVRKRKGGRMGYEISESDYLNQNPELIDKLKNGEVIYC